MKTLKQVLMIFLGMIISLNEVYSIDTLETESVDDAEIEQICLTIIESIDKRTFAGTREGIKELIPLIKKDIKKSEKAIKKAYKQEILNKNTIEKFQEVNLAKTDILNELTHLTNISPASLRVNAERIQELIESYRSIQ